MTITGTATMMSPGELAGNLPDMMRRVRKHHERFIVRQGDDVIMRREPPV